MTNLPAVRRRNALLDVIDTRGESGVAKGGARQRRDLRRHHPASHGAIELKRRIRGGGCVAKLLAAPRWLTIRADMARSNAQRSRHSPELRASHDPAKRRIPAERFVTADSREDRFDTSGRNGARHEIGVDAIQRRLIHVPQKARRFIEDCRRIDAQRVMGGPEVLRDAGRMSRLVMRHLVDHDGKGVQVR